MEKVSGKASESWPVLGKNIFSWVSTQEIYLEIVSGKSSKSRPKIAKVSGISPGSFPENLPLWVKDRSQWVFLPCSFSLWSGFLRCIVQVSFQLHYFTHYLYYINLTFQLLLTFPTSMEADELDWYFKLNQYFRTSSVTSRTFQLQPGLSSFRTNFSTPFFPI